MDSIIHIHNLRFHNPNFLFRQPVQLIHETINGLVGILDLPLQGLFLLLVPMLSRGGKRGLRLCSSSMRSTSETSLSCRAVLGAVLVSRKYSITQRRGSLRSNASIALRCSSHGFSISWGITKCPFSARGNSSSFRR